MRCLELKLFCKWWGIVLVKQVQYEWALSSTRYSRPPKKLLTTFTVSNYPHQSLLCEEPTPPSDVARPNLRPFNQTQHPQSPIHDVASSNPSCVTYLTGRLSAWPASVLFRSWRMLECKFTTQDQGCPWVSASSNNRLGSSIWAAIISARYCFVYFGSRMETLLHFARRRKLFVEEGEWCCAKNNEQCRAGRSHSTPN